MSNSAQIALGG
jgi:hypothetical protein